MNRSLHLLLLLLNVLYAKSSWPALAPELCVVPTTTQIKPTSTCSDATSSTSNCAAPIAYVNAQIGEIEDIQLLLRKSIDQDDTIGGLTNVSIAVNNLPSFITYTTYRVGYVYTNHSPRYPGSGGGWRPDPLLPIRNKPFNVPPSITQPLYVSFTIQRNAIPGKYNGTITVQCTLSDATPCPALNVPVSIHIFNATLPKLSDTNLGSAWSGSWNPETFQDYYPAAATYNNTKHDWFDLMLKARMPPDSIYLTKARNYSDYKYMGSKGVKWFAIMDVSALPLTASLNATSTENTIVPHNGHVKVKGSCANFTKAYVTRMINILRPIVNQLTKDNLLESAYIYGFDENPISCEPQVRQLFDATKAAFPKLKTAAVLNWSPMPIDLPVDIWILQYEEFNATDVTQWIQAGKQQWQYHCIEPHDLASLNTFIERPGMQNRLMMWLGALNYLKYGAPTGWLYYAVNLWRPCNNPLCFKNYTKTPLIQNYSTPMVDFPVGNYIWQGEFNDIFVNGDGQYLYPCEDGMPCGSIRLNQLRDGLEDWDGLFVAAKKTEKGRKLAITLIEEMVRGPRDWGFTGERRMEEIRGLVAELV